MINITVSSNIAETIKRLQAQAKQVPFAIAKSLTDVARQAAVDVKAELPQVLDKPTPFTVSAVRWKGATKSRPESVVYIAPIAAKYLAPLIEGGTSRPTKGKALVLAGADRLNQYGNIPRTRIKTLLRQRNTFAGTIKGIGGIWKRVDGRLELLIRFESEQTKRKQLDFPGIVRRSVERNFGRLFEKNLADALRTAR